jgi:hypothetical protein
MQFRYSALSITVDASAIFPDRFVNAQLGSRSGIASNFSNCFNEFAEAVGKIGI